MSTLRTTHSLLLATAVSAVLLVALLPERTDAVIDSRSCPPNYTLDANGIRCNPPSTQGGAATLPPVRAIDVDLAAQQRGVQCDTAAGQRPYLAWSGSSPSRFGCLDSSGNPIQNSIGGNASAQAAPQAVSCAFGVDTSWINPVCWARAFFAFIASVFVWVGVTLVTLAGSLFDFVIKYGIVEFGAMLKSISSGIETGWTAMRDIANIVIIGMFVFIAINMILGIKDFGDRKKVAKVIIVAVLINFSLLFAKGIIDASNFTAYQFYRSLVVTVQTDNVALNPNVNAANPATAANGADKGIAGRILKLLGVQRFGDSYGLILQAQNNQDSALIGFGYGLLMFIFLLLTAFVLLYGAWLVITRAILLIFVLLTSALAFASWLIPNNFIEQGWEKWWKTLLKGAFFAPILMAMLWATMLVSDALVTSSATGYAQNGSLGKLAENAADKGNIGAMFNFFIILGLLFASFKAASVLSHSISGFGAVSAGLKNMLVGIPALGWRFGVAPLARQTVGRWAYGAGDALKGSAKTARTEAGEFRRRALDARMSGDLAAEKTYKEQAEKKEAEAGRYGRMAARRDYFAKAGYNIGDVSLAKQVAKASGISELVAGQRGKEAGGYKQAIEEKIKSGEERAKALEVSPSERQKIIDQERDKYFESKEYKDSKGEHEKDIKDLQMKRDQAKTDFDSAGGDVEYTKLQTQINDQKRRIEAGIRHDDIEPLLKKLAGTTDGRERDNILREIKGHEEDISRRQSLEDLRLKPLEAAKKQFEEAASAIEKATKAFKKTHDEQARARGQRKVADSRVGAVGTAEVVGRRSAGVFYTLTGQREHIGKEVAGKVRGRVGREGRIRNIIESIPDDEVPEAGTAD